MKVGWRKGGKNNREKTRGLARQNNKGAGSNRNVEPNDRPGGVNSVVARASLSKLPG